MGIDDSAAKSKRRPFTVVSGGQAIHIYCTLHPSEVATFYCATCGDPYDEACVGHEDGENTICRSCSVGTSRPEKKSSHKWLPTALASIAIIISISNGAYYYFNQPKPASEASKPQLTQQVRDIIVCRQRLERIAREASYYHQAAGSWPSEMEMIEPLFEDKTMLKDPLTRSPFEVEVENGQFTVYAPDPDAYGLKALYAVPGKPAKMEYHHGF